MPEPSEPFEQKKRVLVIDDSPGAAELVAMLLAGLGYEAEVALDGAEGLEKAGVLRPHVVLVDLVLPGMSGYEVGELLRKRYGGQITLVAMTGLADDDARRRTAAAGFDRHVVKTGDLDELLALLRDVEVEGEHR